MDSYTAQVVVVVVLRPTVSPSPGELNFVPHIWVKVTEDSKRKNGEWKGWWVVGGCRGLIHARFPTLTVVGGAPLLRVPVIGLGGASGGYLKWGLLSETWI